MATSAREVAVADQYVAAKEAYREDPTAKNEKKYAKLKADLIAIRNEERGPGVTISTTDE